MHVSRWQRREFGDDVELSVDIDGFRLWWRLPKGYEHSRTGDPSLAAALLPAMLQGDRLDIERDLPVSPMLLRGISRLQEIHHCWNPILKKIPVSAAVSPARPLNSGCLSFFSGGVDSTYTFITHRHEITHLVSCTDLTSQLTATSIRQL